MLKQLKWFWKLPKNLLGTILEQPFMRFQSEEHAFQDDLDRLCMLKHLKHFGYDQGVNSNCVSQGDGPCFPGRSGPCVC